MVYPSCLLTKTTPNRDMARTPLSEDSPKVFHALARFLGPDELRVLEADYVCARELRGNVERNLVREEGVSFNPRLARLLVIMIYDLHVTELLVLRATLYSAVGYCGLSGKIGISGDVLSHLPADLTEIVIGVCEERYGDSAIDLIRAVILLDSVRHLHQTNVPLSKRGPILERSEAIAISTQATKVSSVLDQKLSHAIVLQRQRLVRDLEEGGYGQ